MACDLAPAHATSTEIPPDEMEKAQFLAFAVKLRHGLGPAQQCSLPGSGLQKAFVAQHHVLLSYHCYIFR